MITIQYKISSVLLKITITTAITTIVPLIPYWLLAPSRLTPPLLLNYIFPQFLALGATGQLVVLQMESPVHVVDARRDLVPVRHHPEEERPAVGDDGLADPSHPQRVSTEPIR